MSRFDGKGVLVTGAASGIGRATVELLLAEGALVVGVDLGDEAPAGLAAENFTYRSVDVMDADAVGGAVADVVAAAGRLDGVVHAAGVAGGGPVHVLPDEEWDRVVGVNLKGTFVVSRAALAQMVGQDRVHGERGAIVNLASIEGLEGTAGGSAYNASKGGVVLLTKNTAIDYGPSGIRVNVICPGFNRDADVRLGDGNARLRGAPRGAAPRAQTPAFRPRRRDRLGGGVFAVCRRQLRQWSVPRGGWRIHRRPRSRRPPS